MHFHRTLKGAFAASAMATVLTLAPAASADLGHRFIATIHGGAATEAGGGATAELRLFDDIAAGVWFDAGVNLKGTHGKYRYYGPAITGSYRFKLSDAAELRPMFGARFPVGLSMQESNNYTVESSTPLAFTGALRLSFIFDWFVIGVEANVTPHGVTWTTRDAAKKTEDTEEWLMRASLVLGVALGKDVL